MMRRRIAWVGVVACLALAVGLGAWLIAARPRINPDSIGSIRPGMTQAEVEAILGVPPGDYSTGPLISASLGPPDSLSFGWNAPDCTDQTWIGDEGILKVRFRPDGTVATEPFIAAAMIRFQTGVVLDGPSFLGRLRTWLGW